MIYIIIGLIVGLCIKEYSIEERILNGVLGMMIGILFTISVGSLIGSVLPTKEIVEKQSIYALNDNSSINGQYFLFSGNVDEKLVYRYIVETERGKHVEEISGVEVYIKESNHSPAVVKNTIKLAKDWYYWFAVSFEEDYYQFYIPEGSVTHEYNIDLN